MSDTEQRELHPRPGTPADQTPRRMAGSMHDNLDPEWGDPICPCEAEPYWQQAGEEMEREWKAREEKGGESKA